MDERNLTGIVEDYSVQNNDGVIVGADCNTNNSKVGFGACEFDGVDDYIETSLTNNSAFNKSGFTIIAWIFPTGLPEDNIGTILDKSSDKLGK